MKIITLNSGLVTAVDDRDFDYLSQWKWYASKISGRWYAKREVMINGKRRSILLHRLIAGAFPGQLVDHKNQHTLDNQRDNLRIADRTQNAANSAPHKDNRSGFKGVDSYRGKWRARIFVRGKRFCLGTFAEKSDAVAAYRTAAQIHFGEFARA